MKYETLHGVSVPKVGFGTWQIGGSSSPNRSLDGKSLAALHSALALGYTHFDTAEMYAGGHAEELLGQAIREAGILREELFITSKVKPEHLQYEAVLRSCDSSLKRLGTDYIDLYLIHWPGLGMKLSDTFRALNELVRAGKVRHLGVSNFDLILLKRSQEICETPIFTDQVSYSITDRTYVKNGVVAYCQAHDIILTAYSPLGEGHLKNNKALSAICEERDKTIYQIGIAWLAAQPRVITIPMSFDPKHQEENLLAVDIVLTDRDMEQLT